MAAGSGPPNGRVRDGDRTVAELREPGLAGAGRVVGRYLARPWCDRGAVAGRHFVQLTDDGTAVQVWLRGITRDVPPDIGTRDVPVR
ncbi:hypothetical protein GCM10027605_49550 [Micromonospora zhanjiangensis]